jgi:hypothetical protein
MTIRAFHKHLFPDAGNEQFPLWKMNYLAAQVFWGFWNSW